MFVRKIREGVGGEVIGETKTIHFTASIDDKETVYEKSHRWLKEHTNVYDVVYAHVDDLKDKEVLTIEYTEVE